MTVKGSLDQKLSLSFHEDWLFSRVHATLWPALSVGRFWPHCSCPNGLVTSNMAPAYPHATSVAVYPALFDRRLVIFCRNQCFSIKSYWLEKGLKCVKLCRNEKTRRERKEKSERDLVKEKGRKWWEEKKKGRRRADNWWYRDGATSTRWHKRGKSRSQSSTFSQIWENYGFHFLMGKLWVS